MRIHCPVCETAYDVPDRMLQSGRTVRCKRCSTTWSPPPVPPVPGIGYSTIERAGSRLAEADVIAQPAAAMLAVAPPPEMLPAATLPEPALTFAEAPTFAEHDQGSAIDRLRAPQMHPRPGAATWLGWAASVAVIVAIGYGAVARREDVQRVWPATARVYAPLGLADPPVPGSVTKVP